MTKLITFIIIIYLIFRGSRWLARNIQVDHSSEVGGDRPDQKLPIDDQDIEDADFKEIK